MSASITGRIRIDNPDKFKTPRPKKPVIAHEEGNYITFSRPDLIDQFRHNIKPFWLTAGKEKLEALGLADEARAMGREIRVALPALP